jgi:hypothetical protein
MGKHETSFKRVERDHYPSPAWVVDALVEHVDLTGRLIWEAATGNGQMADALKAAGAARVYCSDVANYGYQLDETFDFTSTRHPSLCGDCDIITNPPFGQGGRLAEGFIEAGLQRLSRGGILALLLPADFDSAKTRTRFFRDCPMFAGKIVLTRRVVWFRRTDGKKEQPKKNTAWYLWSREALRVRRQPIILYAPNVATHESKSRRQAAAVPQF